MMLFEATKPNKKRVFLSGAQPRWQLSRTKLEKTGFPDKVASPAPTFCGQERGQTDFRP